MTGHRADGKPKVALDPCREPARGTTGARRTAPKALVSARLPRRSRAGNGFTRARDTGAVSLTGAAPGPSVLVNPNRVIPPMEFAPGRLSGQPLADFPLSEEQ
ncbi:hypothetical protein C8D81_0720 [Enemella evansiae]|nr:hypothetical protein C8D81_0720 [Enemella evansiae]